MLYKLLSGLISSIVSSYDFSVNIYVALLHFFFEFI